MGYLPYQLFTISMNWLAGFLPTVVYGIDGIGGTSFLSSIFNGFKWHFIGYMVGGGRIVWCAGIAAHSFMKKTHVFDVWTHSLEKNCEDKSSRVLGWRDGEPLTRQASPVFVCFFLFNVWPVDHVIPSFVERSLDSLGVLSSLTWVFIFDKQCTTKGLFYSTRQNRINTSLQGVMVRFHRLCIWLFLSKSHWDILRFLF